MGLGAYDRSVRIGGKSQYGVGWPYYGRIFSLCASVFGRRFVINRVSFTFYFGLYAFLWFFRLLIVADMIILFYSCFLRETRQCG